MTSSNSSGPAKSRGNARVREDSAAVLARFETLHPQSIDLSLERVLRLLEALGRPQEKLGKVVHVAGTNGKGSVIAFLKAILEAAGKRTHTFTSPHLVRFHERIALAAPEGAQPVGEKELTDLLLRVEQANAGEPITFFEITTAAALLAFAENPADFVILETGLGGRLDATNVVEKPALTVITPVSRDHDQYLGSDLAGVAAEKAGIIKQDVPCVVARQDPAALEVIEDRAGKLHAPVLAQGQAWDAFEQHGRLLYQTGTALLDLPLPRLKGRHQIDNAGVAVTAARALLGDTLSDRALAQGVTNAQWPARLERLAPGPLHAFVADGSEIWLDGGHNPAAAEALARAMADMEERVPQPLHLICGMLNNKDAHGFLAPFKALTEWMAAVPVPGKDISYAPDELARIACAAGLDAHPAQDVTGALQASREHAGRPVRILICGSLYLAGEVLRQNTAATAA